MFSLFDSGSYGKIYKDKNVVLKEVDLFLNDAVLTSTIRELNIHSLLSKINSEYLIKTEKIVIKGDKVHIYMKYEGKTLTNWININSIENISKNFSKIFKHIIYFLDLFNKLGLIHGDLKPDNIVINKFAKIIDFGASLPYNSKTAFCLCTKEFRAPELEEKECVYTEKTDIFSLSLVLVYMITKKYYIKENYDYISFKNDIEESNYIDNKLKKIIIKMGDISKDNRPDFSEIATYLDLKTRYVKNIKNNTDEILIKDNDEIYTYIKLFLEKLDKIKYFNDCVSIFNIFLNKKAISKEKMLDFCKLSLILYISCVENLDLSINDLISLFEHKYNKTQIKKSIINYIILNNFIVFAY